MGRALRRSWGQSPAGLRLSLKGGAELVYEAYWKGASCAVLASAHTLRLRASRRIASCQWGKSD